MLFSYLNLVPKTATSNNKNFGNLDKINASKHCHYSRQHINDGQLITVCRLWNMNATKV